MTALALDPATSREDILTQLPERLRQRRSELAAALSARLHHDSAGDHDDARLPRRAEETDDDAAAETARERDLADLSRLTAELAQVDAALARCAQGEVGECADCGEPIAPARLYVNPAAARCAECQQLAEHRQAQARLLGG
jgi:DnaK suppressor protein